MTPVKAPKPTTVGDSQLCLSNPQLERTFRGHRNYVTSLAFSPSLKQLASGSGDNCVMLWNFKPQLRAFRFVGHTSAVTDCKFSPDGDVLATASKDKTVRLWVPSAKAESVVMRGHTGPVRSVCFSHDGSFLLTASDDKTAKIWNLPSRKFASSFVGHSNWVRCASFDPTSKLCATGSDDKQVKLWDISSPNPLHTFIDHSDTVHCVDFHTDGSCVVSGSADKTIKMWDIRSHQLIQNYNAHSDAVTSISLHPSGYYMLSSSRDSSVRIWDLREGRLLFTLEGHVGSVNSATFSLDGSFFASAGADQMVMVWKSNLVSAFHATPGSGTGPLTRAGDNNTMGVLVPSTAGSGAVGSRGFQRTSAAPAHTPTHHTGAMSTSNRSRPSTAPGGSSGRPTSTTTLSARTTRDTSGVRTASAIADEPTVSIVRSPVRKGKATPGSYVPGLPKAPSTAIMAAASQFAGDAPKSPKNTYKEKVRNQQAEDASWPTRQALPPFPPVADPSPHTTERNQLPAQLTHTLNHIVGQLDIITRTMALLENRLALTEDRVSTIIAHTRGLQVQEEAPGSLQYGRTTQPFLSSGTGSMAAPGDHSDPRDPREHTDHREHSFINTTAVGDLNTNAMHTAASSSSSSATKRLLPIHNTIGSQHTPVDTVEATVVRSIGTVDFGNSPQWPASMKGGNPPPTGTLESLQYAQEEEERAQNEAEANDCLATMALELDPTDVYYEDDDNAQEAVRSGGGLGGGVYLKYDDKEDEGEGGVEDGGGDEVEETEAIVVGGRFDPPPAEDEYGYDDDSNPFDDHDQSRVEDVYFDVRR